MGETHYIAKESEQNRGEAELLTWMNQIQSLDEDRVKECTGRLESLWGLTTSRCNPADVARLGYWPGQFFSQEDMNSDGYPLQISLSAVHTQCTRHMNYLRLLGARVKNLDLASWKDETSDFELGERICRLIVQVGAAFKNVRTHYIAQERILHPRDVPEPYNFDPEYFDTSSMPLDDARIKEMSPFQRAIVKSLDELFNRGYRRYKGNCMTQRKSEGFYTRAWKPVCTIKQFVYELGQKENNFEVWKDLTSKGNGFHDVIRHLENCIDFQFPEIEKNRNMWSFTNGVFIGKEWSPKEGKYVCNFYSYDSKEFAALDPTLVSSKYFDLPFETSYLHCSDWYDIPTPHFQSILTYQNFDQDVSRWTYAMGGRLTFDTGDLDAWQVIGFFKGVARSGKSTLITKVFKKFYEGEDVKTLSNNIETKFGLSSIVDGFMFVAPEIKSDLKLEQAEFQSLVSGEDVSIAVKHEKAKSLEWRTPGVLGGNEVPFQGKDNSGSILRRILAWNFAKQVRDADPHLDAKLALELPAILYKCVRGYLEHAHMYSDKDIWNVVPQYFKKIQQDIAKNVNFLVNFISSPDVRYGRDLFISQKEFVGRFTEHCQRNNLCAKPKFNDDVYVGPFSSRDVEVKDIGELDADMRSAVERLHGVGFKGRIIVGLTVDDENIM